MIEPELEPTVHHLPDGPLIVVTASRSGHTDVEARLAPLLEMAAAIGRECTVMRCEDAHALDEAAERASRRAVDEGGVVVASGGDGSLGVVARRAVIAGATFGVIPGGTFNLFARTHEIPEDFEAAARNLLDGEVRPARVGSVNGTLFFVNASLGLYPRVLIERERFKRRFGRHRWVAILSAVHTIATGLRPLALSLEIDGSDLGKRRTPTLFVGNNDLQLERVGIEPPPDSSSLVAFTSAPIERPRAFALMLSAALGRLGRADEIERHPFGSLVVHDSRRERRLARGGRTGAVPRLALDGETFRLEPPWRFGVHSQPLRLIVPRDAAAKVDGHA